MSDELNDKFAKVAHQWRQPLSEINSLVGSIDNRLYELDIEDALLSEKLAAIEHLTQNMSKVIDDFRLSAKRQGDEKRAFKDVLKDALEAESYALREKNIELILQIESEYGVCKDASLLKQVLITIINNAKDALIERNVYAPFIKINLFESKERVFIKICDNAGGISKSTMKKIFDSGFTTKHNSEGTGIGLHMCKFFLENRLDAKLDVKNVENGVCFIITFSKELI